MFEDSTFESASRIKTKSGRWMLVTGCINVAILILLILIPLIYPEALPTIDGNAIDAAASATTATAAAAAA
jgi:hypothetical protein